MKAVTIKKLKDELNHIPQNELVEICLKLAKFKKENKELLTYLLFEAHNEEDFITTIKNFIDDLFEEINTKNFYYIRKSIRKILSQTKKFIRYSKKKETEVELLLHFCKKLHDFSPSMRHSQRLTRVFETQIRILKKAISSLHEDLQYDYQIELNKLEDNEEARS